MNPPSDTGRRKRFLLGSALSGIAYLSISAAMAHAGLTDTGVPLGRLASLLKANEFHADHVVLLDLSGSMKWEQTPGSKRLAAAGKARFDAVMDALPSLFGAIPEGDFVEVIGFNDQVSEDPAFLINHWGGESSSTELIRALKTRLTPKGDTDLCTALQAAQKLIQRDGHNELQFVYLVTDGEHDSPKSTLCPNDNAPGWKQLSDDWAGLATADNHNISVYLFGLYDVAEARQIRKALPELKFLQFRGAGDLKAYFKNELGNALHSRVRLLLERERSRGDSSARMGEGASLNGSKLTVPVELHSTFPHLGYSGRLVATTVRDGASMPIGSTDRLSVPAGATVPGVVPLDIPPEQPGGEPTFRACSMQQLDVKLGWEDLRWEPATDIDAAGLRSLGTLTLPSVDSGISYELCRGSWSRWILLVPVLLLAVVAAGAWAFWPRPIKVRIQWLDIPAGTAKPEDQVCSGKSVVRIGSAAGAEICHENFPTKLATLTSLPPGKGGGVMIEVHSSGILLNNKPARIGPNRMTTLCNLSWDKFAIRVNTVA